jgi:hypothetical protein
MWWTIILTYNSVLFGKFRSMWRWNIYRRPMSNDTYLLFFWMPRENPLWSLQQQLSFTWSLGSQRIVNLPNFAMGNEKHKFPVFCKTFIFWGIDIGIFQKMDIDSILTKLYFKNCITLLQYSFHNFKNKLNTSLAIPSYCN